MDERDHNFQIAKEQFNQQMKLLEYRLAAQKAQNDASITDKDVYLQTGKVQAADLSRSPGQFGNREEKKNTDFLQQQMDARERLLTGRVIQSREENTK